MFWGIEEFELDKLYEPCDSQSLKEDDVDEGSDDESDEDSDEAEAADAVMEDVDVDDESIPHVGNADALSNQRYGWEISTRSSICWRSEPTAISTNQTPSLMEYIFIVGKGESFVVEERDAEEEDDDSSDEAA